jgi:hypothetical protein
MTRPLPAARLRQLDLRAALLLVACVATAFAADGLGHDVLAQSPFGVGRAPAPEPQAGGLIG